MVNQDADGSFYLENHHEKTVAELVAWHRSTKTPLSTTTPARLRRPIERPAWLLNHDAIKLVRKLGEGAFGEVYLAKFTNGAEVSEVAVKTMREEATREARLKFMKEARLMRRYQHKHVVRILGVAVHEHPLMLVLELCAGGSLLSHLRTNKGKVTPSSKLRFCIEAADGLHFLERQKCIHRDIAARNCLLSAKSEVYADGAEPYPGLTNIQTRAKIVVQNYRMEMPRETPTAVAKLVALCWDKDPAKRPEFGKIFKQLKEIKERQ
ncbi:Tyrosine-protein kinase [Aphelenchoides fujianensis]|nr:Tyrosine-protein kinase [Aphelenchoides fujianensis]